MATITRSPHKKRRVNIPVDKNGEVWPYKTTTSRNYEGNKGDKGKRRRPIMAPGMGSGKCLGAGKEDKCRCGKHHPNARIARARR